MSYGAGGRSPSRSGKSEFAATRVCRLAIFDEPFVKSRDSFAHSHARPPTGGGSKFPNVRHIIKLVRRAPGLELHIRTLVLEFFNKREQFAQADRIIRPAADVESLSRNFRDVLLREQKRVHEIFYEKNVAHLPSIAVNGDRFVLNRPDQEMRHPTLV